MLVCRRARRCSDSAARITKKWPRRWDFRSWRSCMVMSSTTTTRRWSLTRRRSEFDYWCFVLHHRLSAGALIFDFLVWLHREEDKRGAEGYERRMWGKQEGDEENQEESTARVMKADHSTPRAWTPEETQSHIRSQVDTQTVTSVSGKQIKLPLGDNDISLCCHSDSPGAVEIVKAARVIVDEFNSKHFGE